MPLKLRKEISLDPDYKVCMLYGQAGHMCEGRLTLEHSLTYAGRSIQKKWAIVSLCARGHEVDLWQDAGTMVKSMNQWVALNRATEEELKEISKAEDYQGLREQLNQGYGPWKQIWPSGIDQGETGIHY